MRKPIQAIFLKPKHKTSLSPHFTLNGYLEYLIKFSDRKPQIITRLKNN